MTWQALFLSENEAAQLAQTLKKPTLLGATLRKQQAGLNATLQRPITIPGQGEGGGPEHTQHKLNYQTISQAGLFWQITGEARYRERALTLLTGYAAIYPQLGDAISKDTNPPGRLFHQTLNEHMFLLYAAQGYHSIMASLDAVQREMIDAGLLRLMANDAMTLHASTFDIVHNHGIWSVAAVATAGYVLNDQQMVDAALYGLKRDSVSGGFFAQLDGLFSPDGYYIEGPYYHRFALRPILLLAEAIGRRQPELDIWNRNDCQIRRCCYALFQLAFPDDTLPALNDGSKSMDLRDEGAVMAVSACWQHYGADPRLASLMRRQGTLWPSAGALQLDQLDEFDESARFDDSIFLRDGEAGEQGGLGILRQQGQMAMMWFGQHGSIPRLHSALNHGHFDGLHLSYFSRGREALRDYGFGRWVNVEPKFGGRYLPENNSYCKQTVAHNTVVVDECSQNQASSAIAEQHWGECQFFINDAKNGQGMSAIAREYYPGVTQQRTVLLLPLSEFASPLLLDLFSLQSQQTHQYDYCLHAQGQIVTSNVPLTVNAVRQPLGETEGYQHLWRCAQADVPHDGCTQLTWLDGDSFYSATCVMPQGGSLVLAMSGANDPHFSLRQEPVWLWRTQADSTLFATAIESHGYFDEASETSLDARSQIREVRVLSHSAQLSRIKLVLVSGKAYEIEVNTQESVTKQQAFRVIEISE
jgi:hypothetical protein